MVFGKVMTINYYYDEWWWWCMMMMAIFADGARTEWTTRQNVNLMSKFDFYYV